jgi:hypothetical protein
MRSEDIRREIGVVNTVEEVEVNNKLKEHAIMMTNFRCSCKALFYEPDRKRNFSSLRRGRGS